LQCIVNSDIRALAGFGDRHRDTRTGHPISWRELRPFDRPGSLRQLRARRIVRGIAVCVGAPIRPPPCIVAARAPPLWHLPERMAQHFP
jgi:hypothetical protein